MGFFILRHPHPQLLHALMVPVLLSSGSPAELCQLCVGDEIVAVDGIVVAHMNYDQWRNTMTSALQNGNLNMDIRRYGNKGKGMSKAK